MMAVVESTISSSSNRRVVDDFVTMLRQTYSLVCIAHYAISVASCFVEHKEALSSLKNVSN
jgi:hypothetical protein